MRGVNGLSLHHFGLGNLALSRIHSESEFMQLLLARNILTSCVSMNIGCDLYNMPHLLRSELSPPDPTACSQSFPTSYSPR